MLYLQEVIAGVILSEESYMNIGPVPNSFVALSVCVQWALSVYTGM
jgi:hypothetical protein